MPDAAVPHPAATLSAARRRWILAASMAAMFMAAVEATIVATAMPTIVADLGGFHLFSWVFAAYLLAQAVTIPVYGRLADLYGRKRVFTVAAAVFLVGSALCGFARGMVMLIVFRALQGLGAGGIMPIATTIVGDIYGPADRARVQGWLSTIWGVAAVLGPVIGAFLVEAVHWAAVFWVNLPVGVISIALLAATLRERVEPRRHPVDVAGALLLVVGSGALMLALVQWTSLGAAVALLLVTVAALAFAALVFWEGRVPEPMLPLDLWRNPIIAATNVGAFAIGAQMMATTAFLPTYVQGVMGRAPIVAGFALTALSFGWPIGSTIAGRLMQGTSYRACAVLGGLFLVAGNAMLALLAPDRAALWAGLGATLVGLGMGFANTTYVVAAQSSVAWDRRGIATSSNLFMRMVGQSVGAAILGGILNAGMAHDLGDAQAAVDRLMQPALRATLSPATIDALTAAIGGALLDVFRLAAVLALVALALTFFLPKGHGVRHGQ